MAHAEQTTRTCLASGELKPKLAMIRFVVGPDDELFADLEENLPGRGLWVTAHREAVELAQAKKLFAKANKGPVKAPANLADKVASLLHARCLNTLGLARRAGLVVYGADRVRAAFDLGTAAVLVEASDGSIGERQRFLAMARGKPVVAAFARDELAQALGRPDVVHVGLSAGKLTDGFVHDATRFTAMRKAA
jgi:predicted RNA-binding protein YlxR (DUF448 family)